MKNNINNILVVVALAVGLLLSSCGKSNEWTVDGRIEGADGQTMIIEASNNGTWYPLDSVKLDATGNFAYSHPAAGYPDIYRLRLGDKTLYFPIDSIETVTVITKANAFDTEYTLAGSPEAEKLMKVDKRLMAVISKGGVSAIASDSLLKRELGDVLLGNPSDIVSYYIISKKIGGVPLFNPADKRDLRIIGAVANAYNQYRPNDPRTNYLRNLFISNRKLVSTAPRDTIIANELPLIDIRLYDDQGKSHSLKEVASHGKVVLLNFTVYDSEQSPAFNRQLNALYEKYRDRGFEIYQVSVDDDEFLWKQSARNLPWITVYNSRSGGGVNLANYNVTVLPTSFIIDREGTLVERVDSPDAISAALARYI